jgi:Bacteriophage HK97-gp10, putative tail-component
VSVDVSGLQDAIRALAAEKMECLADTFVEEAQGRAPVRTGELAGSIHHDGVSDTGTSATATVTVDAPYGIYVEHGRGGERGLLAIEVGGQLQVVTSVAPAAAQPFFEPTVQSWSSIVGGCA